MTDNTYETLVLEVNFLGITEIIVTSNKNKKLILLYFCRELDSVDAPLGITIEQARQLYNDLGKLFS